MKYCQFHPLELAQQHCEYCDINVCATCSDESPLSHDRYAEHRCFVCEMSMERVGAGLTVQPFWRHLSDIYRYPLSIQSVIVIILTALIATIFASFTILLLIPTIILTHYCFVCLRHTANGKMIAPDFELSFDSGIASLFYVLIVMIAIGICVGLVFNIFGVGIGTLTMVLGVAILPAAIMVIAIDEKLFSALDPGKLASIVSATGVSYFLMLLFIIVMFSSVAALSSFFSSMQSPWTIIFVQSVISNYYTIVIFHIMGYLVFQNQEDLGFRAKDSRNKTSIRSVDKRNLAKIDILVKVGDYQKAVSLFKQQVHADSNKIWYWERCFKLMYNTRKAFKRTAREEKELQQFSERYLSKLSEQEDTQNMGEVYLKARKMLQSYLPKNNKVRLKVADSLYQADRNNEAVFVLNRFQDDCDDKALVMQAYDLMSRALGTIPGNEDKAKQYRRYSDVLKKVIDV